MKVQLKKSRHARNNIRLYKISDRDIINTIGSPDYSEREGDKFIALKKIPKKFGDYPLKVVYVIDNDEAFIITSYPLKKKHWR